MKKTTLYPLIVLAILIPHTPHACPHDMEPWQEYRLFFGRNTDDGRMVTESEWENFLDQEITPRFPDGLTVLDTNGQYKNSLGTIVKGPTKVLVILVPTSGDTMNRIDEIMQAYGQQFQRTFFLRTLESTCVLISAIDGSTDDGTPSAPKRTIQQ